MTLTTRRISSCHRSSRRPATAESVSAAWRAMEDAVAGEDVPLAHRRGVRVEGRATDHPPPRQALAEVVVGVALRAQGDATRHDRPEALPGRPPEGEPDGVVGQARAAV